MKNQRGVLIVVLVVAVVGGAVWWWKGRNGDSPATPTVAQPVGSGSQGVALAAPRGKPSSASVEVLVTDERGSVGNATVRLAPEDGEVVVVRTDPDGNARADGLDPGAWQISASAAGHEPAALKAQQLAGGATVRLALVLPVGGRTLSGAVTDVSGGPIIGARIDAARLSAAIRPERAIATTFTDVHGRYQLSVAEGHLLVAARSADYAAQSRHVEVGPAGATASFALVPGGAIEGVVLDEKTRQPVPGAAIDARRERSAGLALAETGSHHVIAGEGGKFRIGGLRPGVYELDAGAEGRSTKSSTVIGLGVAEQVAGVELLVGAGLAIRGLVVDERDTPVAGATVAAIAKGERDPEATADAKGAFVIDGIRPGKFLLMARDETAKSAGGTEVEVKDRDVDGVIVRVQRGITIKGHVEPRQVADVRFQPEEGEMVMGVWAGMLAPITTGADGAFELSTASPGKATLTARCASGDQGAVTVDVAGGMPEVVLKVSPGASIAGRVVDGDGKPVSGAVVMAAATGGRETVTMVNGVVTSGVQGMTNASGAYKLEGLAAGTYRLSALERGKPARVRGKAPQVSLAALEKKTGADFAIDRANGVIKGVVLGPDGKPLADAWVSVHQDLGAMLAGATGTGRGGERAGPGEPGGPGGEGGSRMVMMRVEESEGDGGGGASEMPPSLTDAQGRFELGGLAYGAYEVIAEAQAGKLRGRAGDVTPDATLTIRATGLTTLSGTVRGAAGPAALFTVELDGPTRAQRTFTDGKFELGRVDPGAYVVRVSSSDGNAEAKVTVAAGQPATVDLTLVANAIVIGTIVDAAGKPLGGVPLTVVEQQGNEVRVSISGPPPTSGPDGRFRLEHKAGPSALVVLVPPKPITKRGLVLEAGKTLDVGEIRVEAKGAGPGQPAQP